MVVAIELPDNAIDLPFALLMDEYVVPQVTDKIAIKEPA